MPNVSQLCRADAWLSERRRSATSLVVAALAATIVFVCAHDETPISVVDSGVLAGLAYLLTYLVATTVAFSVATRPQIVSWAQRESRGSVLERYILGSAPGPGVSIFLAGAAMTVAVVWLPGYGGTSLPTTPRVAVAMLLVVVSWVCVVMSFAVTFHADNLVEDENALQFPGDESAQWADYVYFAVSVMTTFGTTDVTVISREMRRTVTANAIIAFVFNAVTVAASVTALTNR
ncbi:DUF1345 domain-containing protein [Nocardia spumae]|uniref:DUF1345 domain-containing protein n=1 Tax=Nocardia spumae TaxID=2887190 RepID=UPI001D144259|nr:DUF1345 domain-containing protein [Nocardia spumae]